MRAAKTRLNADGRVVIPAAFRRALGIAPGDEVVLQLQGREGRLKPARAAREEARNFVRKYVPGGESLVDALIAGRKKEARRESRRA